MRLAVAERLDAPARRSSQLVAWYSYGSSLGYRSLVSAAPSSSLPVIGLRKASFEAIDLGAVLSICHGLLSPPLGVKTRRELRRRCRIPTLILPLGVIPLFEKSPSSTNLLQKPAGGLSAAISYYFPGHGVVAKPLRFWLYGLQHCSD